MNYKSYIIEKNINELKESITLFYGENLGLKNFFRQKIKKHYAKIKIVDRNQDEILKNKNLFMSEIFNISLFGEKKIFFVNQVTDKILDLINEIEAKLDDQKIFLFSDLLDKIKKEIILKNQKRLRSFHVMLIMKQI